ncbi:MAG: EAL domain-containing protein [Acidimicrobiia bacterium]
MTLLAAFEWLELGVFVVLAGASLEQWRRRREESAAWLAVTFGLLGGILLADRFVPYSLKTTGDWFDRLLIVDLALFPYCLSRFTSAFPGTSYRARRAAGRGTALVVAATVALPTIPGGHPGSWPWWYQAYVAVFLAGWTALSLLSVARLWRCGRGQPEVARRRMRMLAIAAVVLNLTIFLLANSYDHAWTGLLSGALFLIGFAPPPTLRARWRRPELEAFRRAQADLMSADTSERVTTLMLPHAAGLVGARAAALIDADGQVRACHGIAGSDAADLAGKLPLSDAAHQAPVILPDVVAVRVGSGWLAVVTTASTPFFGTEELGLLQTLARLAGLALERAELFDRERIGRQALAEREFLLAEAQRTARLGSYTWDLRTSVSIWSDEMYRILGFDPGQVDNHGEAFAACVHPGDRERVFEAWQAAPKTAVATSLEYRIILPTGDTRWVHGQVRPVFDDGSLMQLSGTVQDITERKLAEEAILFQAGHDSLTQLPNRALFLDRLGQVLARRHRHPSGTAVLFLDLDRFKWLNDSLGHAAGDELLVTVAARLQNAMRTEDTVARFGGDEFVVVCADLADEAEAEAMADRLASVLAAPLVIAGEETTVTVSIGIAYSPPESTEATPESLVRDADAAMYRAKEQGRNRYAVFDTTTLELALARHETANALRRGIDRGELVVHYQPALDLASGRVVGVEGLVRWNHPQRGLLAPAEFISLAEETGLVVPIGTEVLATACRQVMAWQQGGGGQNEMSLSVNLAARQLLAPDLCAVVEEALTDSGFEADRLCLEITESALLEDSDSSTRALNRLKALGVRIGVDDFGTGFSTLTYLKRFPVDILKIDRSFVAGVCRDREDRAIVASIVDLAHAFGLTTTAEGVETAEQLTELRSLGCEQGQGYLWSRPLPADAAGGWIAARVQTRPGSAVLPAGPDDPVVEPAPGSPVGRHRVLLVDDDLSLRRLTRLVLDDDRNFEVVGEAGDGREAVALARRLHPDLVLLDLAMPGIGGLEALPMIRAVAPDARVVVLSGLEPDAFADATRRQGALAYCAKGGDPTTLPDVLGVLLAQPA